mmetsp:Transcript_16432/g.41978  ORF Transcript_16432/g.41978 Transcript_16432/m.41978 type:complete len:463 (+) Transcript_16432:1191-2579(+)
MGVTTTSDSSRRQRAPLTASRAASDRLQCVSIWSALSMLRNGSTKSCARAASRRVSSSRSPALPTDSPRLGSSRAGTRARSLRSCATCFLRSVCLALRRPSSRPSSSAQSTGVRTERCGWGERRCCCWSGTAATTISRSASRVTWRRRNGFSATIAPSSCECARATRRPSRPSNRRSLSRWPRPTQRSLSQRWRRSSLCSCPNRTRRGSSSLPAAKYRSSTRRSTRRGKKLTSTPRRAWHRRSAGKRTTKGTHATGTTRLRCCRSASGRGPSCIRSTARTRRASTRPMARWQRRSSPRSSGCRRIGVSSTRSVQRHSRRSRRRWRRSRHGWPRWPPTVWQPAKSRMLRCERRAERAKAFRIQTQTRPQQAVRSTVTISPRGHAAVRQLRLVRSRMTGNRLRRKGRRIACATVTGGAAVWPRAAARRRQLPRRLRAVSTRGASAQTHQQRDQWASLFLSQGRR